MSNITADAPIRGRLQGLLMAEPVTVWSDTASGASYTEQVPVPGLPTMARDTHAVVVASGTTEGTDALNTRCQHGGLPGQVDHGMTTAVKRATDARHLGWETPGTIAHWEPLSYGSSSQDYEPDIAALPSGVVVMVARTAGILWSLSRDPVTGWAALRVAIYTGDREVFWPTLLVIEEELYCLAWMRTPPDFPTGVGDGRFGIAVWRSTDGGSTWNMVQDYATSGEAYYIEETTTPSYIGRIRAAYRDGEVIVLAHYQTAEIDRYDWVLQWAGPGLTTRLDLIGQFNSSVQSWALPDVVATPEGFTVAYLHSGLGAQVVRIGSAWQPITTGDVSDFTFVEATHGFSEPDGFLSAALTGIRGLALAYDPAGIVWMSIAAGGDMSTVGTYGGRQYMFYSDDHGATWASAVQLVDGTLLDGCWYSPEQYSTPLNVAHPNAYGACWHRGSMLIASTFYSRVDTSYPESVSVFQLGGRTDLTVPTDNDGFRMGDRCEWSELFIPHDTPQDQGWTDFPAGTNSCALAAGGYARFTTGNGAGATGARYFSSGGSVRSHPCGGTEFTMYVQSGDASEYAEVLHKEGGTVHEVVGVVRIYLDKFEVVDGISGAVLATVNITPGILHTWRLGVEIGIDTGVGRSFQVWYRVEDDATERRWTRVGAWTLTDGSTPLTGANWGHYTASGATTPLVSLWRWLATTPGIHGYYGTTEWATLDQAGGDNPEILHGRPIGSEQQWAMDGFTIAGRRGPGLIGDEWLHPVSGVYDVARAFSLTVPSPRIHHRTVDDDISRGDVIIPWAVDADRPGVEDSESAPIMGLHIECNWRSGKLQYKQSAGAWTDYATIDNRVLAGATYTRAGKAIKANSASSSVYLHADEVDELWTASWSGGGAPPTTSLRHLSGNDEGRWSNASTEPISRLYLESTETGDPTGGGTLDLWSPHCTILVRGRLATAWRIVIDSNYPTADGDYRTKMLWGPVIPLAFPPSWQRGVSSLPGHERTELEGAIGVNVVRAPGRRELRMTWDVGVDETNTHLPDALAFVAGDSGGGKPAGARDAMARTLVRAVEKQAGYPVVWMTWDVDGTSSQTILRASEQAMGTIDGAPDIEVDKGEPGSTEVQRLATLALLEER